jgi:hypothetical protein
VRTRAGLMLGTLGMVVALVSLAHAGSVEVNATDLEPVSHDQRWSRLPSGLSGDGTFIARLKIPAGATITGAEFTATDNDPVFDIEVRLLRGGPHFLGFSPCASTTGAQPKDQVVTCSLNADRESGRRAFLFVDMGDRMNERLQFLSAKVTYSMP